MNYTFPPRDLLMRLVALYFSNVNIFFPVLHRPTFEKTLASHAHLSDDGFAKTVLLVCALGARYSDDPRAHLPATPLGTAGWVWYDQVKLIVSGQPTLTGLQNYCVSNRLTFSLKRLLNISHPSSPSNFLIAPPDRARPGRLWDLASGSGRILVPTGSSCESEQSLRKKNWKSARTGSLHQLFSTAAAQITVAGPSYFSTHNSVALSAALLLSNRTSEWIRLCVASGCI